MTNKYLTKAQLYGEVEQIRQQYGLCCPFNPFELSQQLGIEVLYRNFDSRKLCGALIRGRRHTAIVLNEDHLPTSQKFTCSHELSHYFLHTDTAQFLCDGDSSPIEWQANAAAAELLMPYRIFLTQIKNICSKSRYYCSKPLLYLAEYFKVTPLLVRQRIDGLSYEIQQVLEGVPIDEVVILSESKRRLLGLPKGPSADELFAPVSIDIWAD